MYSTCMYVGAKSVKSNECILQLKLGSGCKSYLKLCRTILMDINFYHFILQFWFMYITECNVTKYIAQKCPRCLIFLTIVECIFRVS